MQVSWFKVFRLASRDYFHEGLMSACFVLALAAVLGPMMVLFGLKFGIVGAMVDELIENPGNREVRPVGRGYYDHAWLEQVRARDDVAFLVPRTRSIAATIDLNSEYSARIVSVELMATDHGDPLLLPDSPLPQGTTSVVLSQRAAEKLGVAAGDTVDGSLARRFRGKQERVHLPLRVAAVAPARAFSRDGAFVSLTLLEALEDFRDGRAVPALGWEGEPAETHRTYPGFRLYAQTIYDVAGLRDAFTKLNVNVHTRSAEIELVQRMNRNLTAIYWSIAIVGLVGFSLSFGASLWANVDRKRKDLSVLRLVGFRTADIVWFPMVQALFTAILGWALAVAIFQTTSLFINDMLAAQLVSGQKVCRLLPWHYAIALLLTCTAAVLSAGLAGLRSARVEPSDSLRDL